MSIHVASIVWRTELGGPSVKAVAMKLADCADDDGTNVYPGRRKLARETETSERTVDTAITALVELKVLVLVEKGGKGPGHTNEYKFDLDVLWKLHAETLRKWKEQDDKVKVANFASLNRSRRRKTLNNTETNNKNEGAESEGSKVANSAPLEAKVANSAKKVATIAKKGAAVAPNPSLPVLLDSSDLARDDAHEDDLDSDLKSEGPISADPEIFSSTKRRASLKIEKAAGMIYRPDVKTRDEARRVARGWDLDAPEGPIAQFNALNEGTQLYDPEAAFLGFCRKLGSHPNEYSWKPTGKPVPKDCIAQPGEIAIAKLTPSWDRWQQHLDHVDRVLADRMRRAFVIFAPTKDPSPQSALPRIPLPRPLGKSKGEAA